MRGKRRPARMRFHRLEYFLSLASTACAAGVFLIAGTGHSPTFTTVGTGAEGWDAGCVWAMFDVGKGVELLDMNRDMGAVAHPAKLASRTPRPACRNALFAAIAM